MVVYNTVIRMLGCGLTNAACAVVLMCVVRIRTVAIDSHS